MGKDCCKVKDQFKARAGSFEASARWVKDKDLLGIHQELAGTSKDNLILEVCCGTGVVGKSLFCQGSKITGLDISLSMLEKAKNKLQFCVNGNAEQIPFLDEIFDIVVCRQAFHFLDTKQIVKEMLRVLKRGGKIIISQIVPFGQEDADWLRRIHRKKQPLLKNFLREQDLKDLLKETGCADIVSREHVIEESISNWLKDTYFSKTKIDGIKEMFLNAPKEYKEFHKVKVVGNDIFDRMKWVVIRGRKL